MKINNPTQIDPRNLKIGDKLRVKKKVYRATDPNNQRFGVYFNTAEEANAVEPRGTRLPYVNMGDVYNVTGVDFRDPNKPKIVMICYEIGDEIGPTTALKLINFGVFELVK